MIAELTKNTDNQIRKQNHNNQNHNNPPEAELLLSCIRYQLGTATSAEIAQLLQPDLDWDYLIQKATQHNVFLLFYQSLKQVHPELIPTSISQPLQMEAQKRIARNLFLTQQLFQVLDLFAAHHIQAIPFKGPVWATLAYGNMALREFCDLDILVRPEDFPKAKELLISQGYHDPLLGTKEQEIGQVQMRHQERQVNIDLHFGLVPPHFYLPVDSAPFFEGLQTISVAGKDIATFSPENSVALGYIHGTKDSWSSLKRICDFAALIRTYPDVDWQDIVQRCGTNESDRNFWFAILITQTYLQISLPEQHPPKSPFEKGTFDKKEPFPEISELVAQHKQLFYRSDLVKCHLFGGLKLSEMMEMSLWGKVRYALGKALDVNQRDKETLALPSFLYFLYYPLRVIRLIKTYKIGTDKIAFLWNFLRR
jgi:hypothetical protein